MKLLSLVTTPPLPVDDALPGDLSQDRQDLFPQVPGTRACGRWPPSTGGRLLTPILSASSFRVRPWRRAAARTSLSGLPWFATWACWGLPLSCPSSRPLWIASAPLVVSAWLMLVVVMSLPPKNSERGRFPPQRRRPRSSANSCDCQWRLNACPPRVGPSPETQKAGPVPEQGDRPR